MAGKPRTPWRSTLPERFLEKLSILDPPQPEEPMASRDEPVIELKRERHEQVVIESLEEKIQRIVRAELRRCELRPPRPAAQMVDGGLRTWVWDGAQDAWVPGVTVPPQTRTTTAASGDGHSVFIGPAT